MSSIHRSYEYNGAAEEAQGLEELRPDKEVLEQWQAMIELLAEISGVPSVMVLKAGENGLDVFLASENKGNPFERGESLSFGEGLLKEDVLSQDAWFEPGRGPDAGRGLYISGGCPIRWPGGLPFGTLCALSSESGGHGRIAPDLFKAFRTSIEKDLALMMGRREEAWLKEQLSEVSLRDGLTGLYNHLAIHEFLFYEIENAVRYEKRLSVALVDIDRFKEINEIFGHKMGNIVLQEMSELMTRRFRASDVVGRYGGDEFLAIFTDTGQEDAFLVAERLRKEVEGNPDKSFDFTISVGIATLQERCTAEEFIGRAEEALDKARQRGMNRVVDY